ncbi:DUF5412 family protein [Evansella cellulosilytica]|uniref:Uncharacterized protein n=1 Tax=Evansella cellulosilytica (strain ATCC 21833 / DSM 2522 / FERM P-1141 / JCM 9156 / N-4) TaxID=649639 RepID=E6TU59_EVAC2|nr:DUF5412 family protein [Evansella cellulosilytica]ADU28519.1 hypothetical protein Bcell_0231 [Evansella cellulosilytica DSM 2522]
MRNQEEDLYEYNRVKKETYKKSLLGCFLAILLIILIPIIYVGGVFISSVNEEQVITESTSPNNLEKITIIQKGGGFLHRGSTVILKSSNDSIKVPIHEGSSLQELEIHIYWENDEEATISILEGYVISFNKSNSLLEKSFKVVE